MGQWVGKSGFLMDVKTLSERLGDPLLRIVDCRFSLLQPKAGRKDYLQAHIPGAVYANLDHDLAAPVGASTGRHPLPDTAKFAEKLGEWGIDNDTHLLVYDQNSGAIAARLWWMLRWLGHKKVTLLDGGFAAWTEGAYAVEQGNTVHRRRDFVAAPAADRVASTADIISNLQQDSMPILVDARDAERFAGISEPIDVVAGHIPGAVNFPVASSLDASGCWLSWEVLQQRWQQILSSEPETRWIAMCGSGVTACHLALSAEYAGFATPAIYVGSWSEWVRDPARPVVKVGA